MAKTHPLMPGPVVLPGRRSGLDGGAKVFTVTRRHGQAEQRLHIRPYFGGRQLGAISAQVVQRWQNELERKASHNLTMASGPS